MYYLSPDEAGAAAVEAEIFAAFRDQIGMVDVEAIADDGSIIGRNSATGELEPDATRTTGFYGSPQPSVQGWYHPVPEDEALQLADPAVTGVEVVANLNPGPTRMMGNEPTPLPEWKQPQGAHDSYPIGFWLQHRGANYCSLVAANVWEPSPQSTLWRISPDPGPLPWRQPSGAADAYDIDDQVTHTVAGRDTDLWESNIAANTQEPGQDGTFDRWWKPMAAASSELLPWVQPVPGTANAPYEEGARVMFGGEEVEIGAPFIADQEWVNTVPLNVWPPTGAGAYGWVLDEPTRARDASGRFVADDVSTPNINEAWA